MRPLSSSGSLPITLPVTLRAAVPTVSRAPLGVLAALLALAVLLGPASATAQPHGTVVPTDTAAHSAGMRYLEAGVAAASAQRFAEAAASFEQAFALLGDIEISYNVGAMRERAGDLPGALRAYERFPVKGFAITLLIGVALSLFSSLFITKTLLFSSIKALNIKETSLFK